MTKMFKNPFELVASVLKLPVESLNANSTMGEEPNWDSMNHIAIIVEIEKSLGISIHNDDIMKYSELTEIIKLFEIHARIPK